MAKKSIYKTVEGRLQIINFYENLLSQWHHPSKQYFVETYYGSTFIIESGQKDAPPVLLLHGSGSNSAMWMNDVKALSSKYRVFAIDIIGECGKSAENRPDFKSDHYAKWLHEIINNLKLNIVSIVSCSLGGWIALDFASRYPDVVRQLVLLATAGITPIKLKSILWIMLTSIAGNWGFRKLNQMVYGNLDIDKKALEFARLIKSYYKPRTDVLPVLSNNTLRKIKVPIMFIGGETDCFYKSDKTAARLEENLVNVECKVLHDTGHVVINQSKKIIQFLNGQQNEA